jgi:branched-chain amino acid transport system ATP-binding protein
MLELQDVHTYYGPSHVLHGIAIRIGEGDVVSVMGRNGAGKTTLLRTIMGLTQARSGSILFNEKEITSRRPHDIYLLGIKLVPQGRKVFAKLTVEENLQLALVAQKVDTAAEIEKAYRHFPILGQRKHQRVRGLSGGERQMLAIARGLLGFTTIVLMDEPTEGLAPIVVRELRGKLLEIKRDGVTIFLAEQNVKLALSLCDRHYIMEKGEIRFEGSTETMLENKDLMIQYLGVSG